MRMARVNVYVPDALAEEARAAGLNVSRLTQDALETALRAGHTESWLDSVAALGTTAVSHDEVLEAVAEAKRDFEGRPR